MASIAVRETTRTVGETAPGGDFTRDEKVLEYGVEVDGAFVRIGTVTEGQVEDAKARADAEQANEPRQEQAATGTTAPKKNA